MNKTEGQKRNRRKGVKKISDKNVRYRRRPNNSKDINPNFTDEQYVNKLLDLLDKKDMEGLSNAIVGSQKFIAILNTNLSDLCLVRILKLVSNLCRSTAPNVNKNYITKVIVTQKFVTRLNIFLTLMATDDKIQIAFSNTINDILEYMTVILDTALNLMPVTTCELVKTALKNLKVVVPALKREVPIKISSLTEDAFLELQKNVETIDKMFENPNITHDNNEIEPLENYRQINIYPDKTELLLNHRSSVRKNIVDRPYSSVAQYLDIHFRLLREDFINPIREDICDYISGSNRRLFNIKIYDNVRFLERTFLRNCRAFRIQFNIPQWIHVSINKGERQKRFLNGSLLLFTCDNFDTMIYGKVVETRELKYGRILVDIPVGLSIPKFDKNYTMIECVIFFEPYHQVLTVWQKLSYKHLPLENYLISINTGIHQAEYMRKVNYVNQTEGLNPSQEDAYDAAIKREFVVVQGPPGTGKTFLGMKIVEEILNLQEYWHGLGPILIICFTNHALDQFLEGLRKVTDKVARLGGKSGGFIELSAKFGPEAIILGLLKGELKHETLFYQTHGLSPCGENNKCKDDCDYKEYRRFLGTLKSNTMRNYTGPFRDVMGLVPNEVKQWLKDKKRLTESYIEIKHAERDVKVAQKCIHTLNSLKSTGIFKTSFLLAGQISGLYYHFNDFQLACWLLCDDGTVKSDWETVDNVGQAHKRDPNEINNIYWLLSNCLGEEQSSFSQVFLTVGKLSQLHQFVYEFTCNQSNASQIDSLNGYLDFIANKIDYLKVCFSENFGPPPEVDFTKFKNPFLIPCKNRWQIYNRWIETKEILMKRELDGRLDLYQEHFFAHNIIREADNVTLLKRMDIVGMTTTCAAKMRSTLEALENPIVVVEEAAEVLESHIVAAITDKCQHLILLGDHKQLRPSTSDYTIEKEFNLGISLFERMVNNNVQCHTLNIQHRMRPEISKLLKPTFYEDLQDSESVKEYPDVSGIAKNLYFIDHRQPEEAYGDSSKMNIHEAKFLIQLTVYLLKNNYQPTEITILAAYLGQVHILKEERGKCTHPLVKEVHITSVDNFQGEENRIILLSLVRSNLNNSIGFLSIDNRVCVALSRAREGLYIMGNMSILFSASKIWKPIKESLEEQNAIGQYLILRCQHHKEFLTPVSISSDFAKIPEGGCNRQCDADLECGHHCTRKCHGYDLDHEMFVCKEPCNKSLCGNLEHKCQKLCSDDCGSCTYLVEKLFRCGHKNKIKCSVDPEDSLCGVKLTIKPESCEHIQAVPCHLINNFICEKQTEHKLPCGHEQMVPCNVDVKSYKCQHKIQVILACNHAVVTECHNKNIDDLVCSKDCHVELDCGHVCYRKCHKNDDALHEKYKCKQTCLRSKSQCNNTKIHPKCNLPCWAKCEICTIKTISFVENCSHLNEIQCYLAKVRTCQKRCNKELPCGHNCQKICYEDCGPCDQKTYKTSTVCGHQILVKCNETPSQSKCEKPCDQKLRCGHTCSKLCKEKCTSRDACKERCKKVLTCGHPCIKLCNEIICACKREKFPECEHWLDLKCGEKLARKMCGSSECRLENVTKRLEKL